MNRDNEDGNNTIIEVSMVLEAAKEGNVATLNHLIEKDSLILTRVSLTNSTQSPLHISAALNHLHFTKQLIHLKPELAFELDSFKRSPLHLAAAEGHMEIARALVHVNRDVSLVKDMYGRIPLHYAAMRGRVDVVQLLLDAQPESVFELLPSGETVLHLCVRHNHLETLRLLVEAVLLVRRESAGDFLNAKEESGDGNTILHLAVMLNQAEVLWSKRGLGCRNSLKDVLSRRKTSYFEFLHIWPRRDTRNRKCLILAHSRRGERKCGRGEIPYGPGVISSIEP